MQLPLTGIQPLGVVFNTAMNRPDAALALALLYGFQSKTKEAKIASICVNGAGLGAAVFCDVVNRFYLLGQRNSNTVLPTGFAAHDPLPPDPAMVIPAIERKTAKGESEYVRDIRKVSDTSLPEAVLRNSVTYNPTAAIVLSAPATYLAKTLDLLGAKQLYKERVKMLVVVDSGAPQDAPAMRKVLAEFPVDVVFCPKEVGDALRYPAASIEKDFTWAPANPVIDAYRAFHAMPYDAPSYDLAAILYAVRPGQGFFRLSEAGSLKVGEDGMMKFAAGAGGKVRSLIVDPAQKDRIMGALIELAIAKPVMPPPWFRPAQAPPTAAAKTADAAPPDVKPKPPGQQD